MFVRAKSIKGQKYAYLVNNKWVKGKVKQETKKYLGKIINLDELNKTFFDQTQNINIDFSLQLKEIMKEIIKKEFFKSGFKNHKRQNAIFFENILINFSTFKIQENSTNVVLMINKRYFYSGLLRELINFYKPESSEDIPGQKLAKTFSDAGINISKEDFVNLYKKIYLNNV